MNNSDLSLLVFEVERRKGNFYKYNTGKKIHEKQLNFHRDQSKSRWVFGGNRTGKTECGAMEVIWWAIGLHPFRSIETSVEGWVVSLSLQVQRDVAQAKILKYLPPEFIVDIVMRSGKSDFAKNGVIDFITVRNCFGGVSKIAFKSCDQGREKFQGTGLDFIWFDEEPPEDIYEECLLRTLDRGGAIWGTMTPLKKRNWLYEKIFLGGIPYSPSKSVFSTAELASLKQSSSSKPDILDQFSGISIHSMSWDDNPFLKRDEILAMEKRLSHDVLESRKYGRFTSDEGLVLTEFDDENIIDPIDLRDRSFEYFIGIDPAYVAPTGVVWVAYDGENFFVVDDYSVSHKTVDEHSTAILAKTKAHGITDYRVLIDNSATQKTLVGTKTVESQFKDCGLDVNTSVNKNVIEGVMTLKSLMKDAGGGRRLFVTKNCVNLIREIRNYSWGDNDRPIKRNDHCIDALRYIVMFIEGEMKKKVNSSSYISKKKNELLKQRRIEARGF